MGKKNKSSASASISRRSQERRKAIQALSDDPIIIPHDDESIGESPLPADNHPPIAIVIVGIAVVALLGAWWLAPEWLASVWKNLIHQFFQASGQ